MSNNGEKDDVKSAKAKTHKKKRRKTKTNKFKIILSILSLLVLIIGGLVAGGYLYTTNLLNKLDQVEINKEDLNIDSEVEEKLAKFDDIQNIALFGVDATDGETGRSDSIMILTIDRTKKEIRLSSIMRDSYVEIPGRKNKDKINHAYAYGGPELALKTINENYDLNIKDFASVDFSTLPKIIDLLGGLDLYITQEEIDTHLGVNDHINHLNTVNGTNSPHLTTGGYQHVDGIQALAYSRIRYTAAGDEGRTHRHQAVFGALLDKFEALSPTEYPKLLSQLFPMVKTSLSSSDILSLAKDAFRMGKLNLNTSTFPKEEDSENAMINDVFYLKFDEDETIEKLHKFMFEGVDVDAKPTNTSTTDDTIDDSSDKTSNSSNTTKKSN